MPAFTAPMSLSGRSDVHRKRPLIRKRMLAVGKVGQQVIIYTLPLKDTGIVIDLPFPNLLDSAPGTHSDGIVGTINSHYYPQMTSYESQ
jgi:hypothetical protein